MDKQHEKEKFSLRSKSPIIMSNRQKMALLNCNEQSTSNIHGFNENPKVLSCKYIGLLWYCYYLIYNTLECYITYL